MTFAAGRRHTSISGWKPVGAIAGGCTPPAARRWEWTSRGHRPRLLKAINEHDLDEFAGSFALDYHSEQPAHPNRAFTGRDTARSHWSNFFSMVPDFRAEVLRFSRHGDTEWAEWHWYGTQKDGRPFDIRGVIIMGVGDGDIAWGRLYMEPVEEVSQDHYGDLESDPS